MSDTPERNTSAPPSSAPPAIELEGIAGSPGLAIGKTVVVDLKRVGVVRRHIKRSSVDDEVERFDAAVKEAAKGLRHVAAQLASNVAAAEASILEAYIMMVEDASLKADVERHIRLDLLCAEWAVDRAVKRMAEQLRGAGDAYLAERSHDIEFIGDRILGSFSGRQRAVSLPDLDEPAILVARDLSPAETAGLKRDFVLALVTEVGTRTSHTAILARALDIPAVVGVGELLARVGNGDRMIVDGLRGSVVLNPTAEQEQVAQARAERRRVYTKGLAERRDHPAQTACGVPIRLRANIELPNEAAIAMGEGAQGIGLYRTEFLYVDRKQPPSEQEQYEIYRQVLEQVAPLPVTLRTFDIGGDKFVSAFQVPQDMNPALGLRAIRLGLSRPETLLTQLRAMVRASVHGELRIMVPMVATLTELRAVHQLFGQAVRDIESRGLPHADRIPLGIMIEVPSAAVMAYELSLEADFLSIGTNDLVQYALAVDRTSHALAYLAKPQDPAILRLIAQVVDAGRHTETPVGVCGAMASDPLSAILLVGMGVRELSMEASALAEIKEALGRVTLADAEAVAREVRGKLSATEVNSTLHARFDEALKDLLDLHG
ncbi:MAG: phosphoenolpyruvate--protein phosphotransferase [Myxococcales bacterium]|nr:phosphoenolpyruvate--protein phosphotransferase [Myxococcales bacterium]